MNYKRLPGVLALGGAVVIVFYLLTLRGSTADNTTGLLIELAGVFLEVVLIALVVDRLAENREARRWKTLHSTLGATIQRCVVDLMRCHFLFVVPQAVDIVRRLEFLDFVRFSLGDLRSQVESFTASLDTESQAMLRSLEQKFNYLYRTFHSIYLQIEKGTPPAVAYETHIFFQSQNNWTTLISAAEEGQKLLDRLGVSPEHSLNRLVNSVASGRARSLNLDPSFPENFYRQRFSAQDRVLKQTGLGYILLDAAGSTIHAYYLIDCLMLAEIAPLFAPSAK